MDWGFCFGIFCLLVGFLGFFNFQFLRNILEVWVSYRKFLCSGIIYAKRVQVSLNNEKRKHHLHISFDTSVNTPQMYQFRDWLHCLKWPHLQAFCCCCCFFKTEKLKAVICVVKFLFQHDTHCCKTIHDSNNSN